MKSEDRSRRARVGGRRPLIWADVRERDPALRQAWCASVDASVIGSLYTDTSDDSAGRIEGAARRKADPGWTVWQSTGLENWLEGRRDPGVAHWGGVWFERRRCDPSTLDWERWDEDLGPHLLGFRLGPGTPELAERILDASVHGAESWNLRQGCWGYDPLGYLLRNGRIEGTPSGLERRVGDFFEWSLRAAPSMRVLVVSADLLRDAGASPAVQVGFAAAMALEYLRWAERAGVGLPEAAARMQMSLGAAGRIFPEIAKFRAARLLWSRVLQACGMEAESPFIHIRVSGYDKSLRETSMNLIRTTFDAFAAIVGGADSLETPPHTMAQGEADDEHGDLATKVQWILEKECHLGKVVDPGGGSWAIESMTKACAREAWAFFQEVESEGGAFDWILRGKIQSRVQEDLADSRQEIAKRERVLVGVSLQPDSEQMPKCDHLDADGSDPKEEPAETGLRVPPLRPWRLARPFEEVCCDVLRWKRKKGFAPRVLACVLRESGGLRQAVAPMRELCREAGFDLIAVESADTADVAIRRFAEVAPEGVVLCATGETLAEIGTDVVRRLYSGGAKFVIASLSHKNELDLWRGVDASEAECLAFYPGCDVLRLLHEALVGLGARR